MLRQGATALLIVAMQCLTGCASTGADALIGEVWRWEGQSGPTRGEWLEIPHPGRYTIAFARDGSYTIRADCNTGNGGYTVEGDAIDFGLGALTQKGCDANSLDRRFLQSLKQVRDFSRDDASLALRFGGGKGEMRFAAARRVDLEGTTWRVRGYNNGRQAVVSVLPGVSLDATFGADGRVTGSAGCNRYFASFSVEGEALSLGPVGASRRACAKPDGVMQQEAAFLAALGSVSTWRVRGERLELRSAGGSRALNLVAAVAGTLSLPEGVSFPFDGTVTVQVLNVSLSNAPSVVIGEQVRSLAKLAIPIHWVVSYDPADVDDEQHYAVIASVRDADGRIVLTTTESVPVLHAPHPSVGVDLVLDGVH
jgi:heat shock protein HslJ